jgi:hypothetical protein
MRRWVRLDKNKAPSSSPYDGDQPISFNSLLEKDRSNCHHQSIFNVILSVLYFLSKATKTSQLNDYLLTYHYYGPKRWLEMQLEEQAGGDGAEIYINSPGIEYRGDALNLHFKPLIVHRKRYYWSAIIYNF